MRIKRVAPGYGQDGRPTAAPMAGEPPSCAWLQELQDLQERLKCSTFRRFLQFLQSDAGEDKHDERT
jgi:hypothetical protein